MNRLRFLKGNGDHTDMGSLTLTVKIAQLPIIPNGNVVTRSVLVPTSRASRAIGIAGGVRSLCLVLADHGLSSLKVSDTHVAIDERGDVIWSHAANNVSNVVTLCTLGVVVEPLRKANAMHLSDGLNAEVSETLGVLGSAGTHTDAKL